MQFFTIPTIKAAIEHLQEIDPNWLLTAFVLAANDVGSDEPVDLAKAKGTDKFLDRYFNGARINIAPFPSGKNLLRPRLKGIKWNSGPFAGDHMIRQDTKLWANILSSRGYREMLNSRDLEGSGTIVRLSETFQNRFEEGLPESFRFENFLIWLFAFEGFPDEIQSWQALYEYFLEEHMGLSSFGEAYSNRFKISDPANDWPETIHDRPKEEVFLAELAPKLSAKMKAPATDLTDSVQPLSDDNEIYAAVLSAISSGESLAFLLAGPPGTGKTYTARLVAQKLADGETERMLYLQFHPALSYDDFIEGFRPEQTSDGQGVVYRLDDRLFLKFAENAKKNPDKLYVIIVDELNRGDVARIFGEVLTYIEPDYRGIDFTLPYSGKPVSLPKNLVIIATANPYDRSVTDLDDALLRRFWLVELSPDGTFLRKHLKEESVEDAVINRTVQMFNILNEALPHGYGHTSFLRVRSVEDLVAIWMGRVRMTLRRGLFHDPDSFKTVEASIEDLLQTSNNEEQNANQDDGGAG